ncbi:MAG: D-cysteine desulfhydrase family protein [Chloroflexota bacterium]
MALTSVPRVELGLFPTPIHEMPNLSRVLGPRLWVKREDLTGLGMGGNKTRQVERILAHVRATGADSIITNASSQSNYCLQLAAGARRLGLKVGLTLFAGIHPKSQGNMLLQRIIGSDVKVFDEPIMEASALGRCEAEMEKMAAEFRSRGLNPCIVLQFKPSPYFPLAASGWVDAAEEIHRQLVERDIKPRYVVLAAGSGCSTAGLILGFKLLGVPIKVIAMAVSRKREETRAKILSVADDTIKLLGVKVRVEPEDVIVHEYMGGGYGLATRECLEAIHLVAQTEGIFLDPVYSGKAAGGLIDLCRKGEFTPKDTVLFIHTGGTPLVFAYEKDLVG